MEDREKESLTDQRSGEEEPDQAIIGDFHDSPQRISAVDDDRFSGHGETGAVVVDEEDTDDDDNSSEEFEFPFLIRDEAIAAGEPVYPVFGRVLISPPPEPEAEPAEEVVRLPLRRLLIEERNSSIGSSASTSSSMGEMADLEGVPPESYCVWAPGSVPQSPARCQKSGSTGSLVRWRRISDLVLGRSKSDGKEKFVFLSVKEKEKGKADDKAKVKGKGKGKGKANGGKVTELDAVTAHRFYYGKAAKAGGASAAGAGGGRKSFLPYRQDLVGLFASVNGISRSHYPF